MTEGPKRLVIDRDVVIPLGVVATICFAIMATYGYLNDRFGRIEQELFLMRSEMKAMTNQVEEGVADRWRKTHMRLWTAELRQKNPSLVVPDVQAVIDQED